jgi:hypothetical protein
MKILLKPRNAKFQTTLIDGVKCTSDTPSDSAIRSFAQQGILLSCPKLAFRMTGWMPTLSPVFCHLDFPRVCTRTIGCAANGPNCFCGLDAPF